MHKRGNESVAAGIILLVVVGVALVGIWYVNKPLQPTIQYPAGQAYKYVYPCITDADCAVHGMVCQKGNTIGKCVVSDRPLTAYMAVPQAKEYGGAIRGVAQEGQRAFPGRAFELPPSGTCYKCTCPDHYFGMTASSMEVVRKQCDAHCEGASSVSLWHEGVCSSAELDEH